ncbi:MAG: toxin-antitoxin system HicB family antitoxin [Phormidesmis sp. RL_2_1]|nr:toxin-antitoxin system HicB family antitoxin [Phormidesmis sp. RL_2_1]
MSNVQTTEDTQPIKTEYSGELLLTMPKTLHSKLAEAAVREGIDLNQYLVALLSEQNARQTALSEMGNAMGDMHNKLDEINRQLKPEDASDDFRERSARDQRARQRRLVYDNRYVHDWESGLND